MCRVLLMNKQAEKEIEKTYGLDRYLKYLEKQMGGHGNGFALMKNGKIIKLEKGVKPITYFSRCVDNEILMFLRKNKKNIKIKNKE